jgi:hypothetical protein
MAVFHIEGPFEIPYIKGTIPKLIVEDLSAFWNRQKSLASSIGCYVFAARAGRGFTPLYIGKTTKSFESECFTSHKKNHYHYSLRTYLSCTPVMFFVVLPKSKGKINASVIKQVENFLIQVGSNVNPEIRNVKGACVPSWSIKGVIRGKKGQASKSTTAFKKLLSI